MRDRLLPHPLHRCATDGAEIQEFDTEGPPIAPSSLFVRIFQMAFPRGPLDISSQALTTGRRTPRRRDEDREVRRGLHETDDPRHVRALGDPGLERVPEFRVIPKLTSVAIEIALLTTSSRPFAVRLLPSTLGRSTRCPFNAPVILTAMRHVASNPRTSVNPTTTRRAE